MLTIRDLNIQFNDKVIFKDASFSALKGELTVIQGRSGIGKSTFLKTLIFEHPCSYEYDDMDLSSLDENMQKQFIYEKLSFVEQVPRFLNGMRISEHIKQYEKLGYKRNMNIETKLHISSMLNKLPHNLSGGERVRAAIYLAIMKQPDILILDEPTASLDKNYVEIVIEILKDYAHSNHIVIIASHDKRVIQSADTIYDINHYKLVSNKEIIYHETSLQPFQQSVEKNYKHFNIQLGYRNFRIVMICMVSLTMIVLVFSSHIYQAFQNDYQSQIDKISSAELLVYKPKYDTDYEYSYQGLEYSLSSYEISQIENIEYVEFVDVHVDINNWGGGETYDDNVNQDEDIYSMTLLDQNMNMISEYKPEYDMSNGYIEDYISLDYHSYNDSETIEDRLAIQFQDEGVIITQSIYEELLKQSESSNLNQPYLSFNLYIPQYNIAGNGQYDDKDVNVIYFYIKNVTLPIKGVLDEDETLYNVGNTDSEDSYSIFIETSVYQQYIDEYLPEEGYVYYSLSVDENANLDNDEIVEMVEDDGIVYRVCFYNHVPEEFEKYMDSSESSQYTYSPWSANSVVVKVDDLTHMQSVIEDIEELGFRVNSEYANSSAITILSSDNQNILVVFFVSIVIIIYAFYIYLKYLMIKEETNVRYYLSSLGLTFKETQHIIQKTYFKSFVILALCTCIILRILIEVVVKIYIVPLIISPQPIYFIFIIVTSFILEMIIPLLLQKVRNYRY
ncbi:MAG: ATP-binding cassette domain-containing protein [Erysipelotrichaceae bacterium]|nr:ATP-binding cassette domain-containing protein [Erysipelotrichaceae bacterium]